MKTLSKLSLVIAAALAAGSVVASADEKSSNVTVAFHEADKFTDVRSHFGGDTDEGYLKMLSQHLQRSADKRLAPGHKLEVTFTDIDLAGDYLPSAAQNQDIRVIREIYIPRMKLSFRLLDENGKVINEGERRLSNMDFMNDLRLIGRNDPLFYDKNLLDDWINKEFKS
jgi:hypothetical protein